MSTINYNSKEYLGTLDKYFRAANYLSLAQLYLKDNVLLKEPLDWSHVKKRILGHWGTVPGQNFIYAHLDRVVCKYDLNAILISGPGHGGNFFIANSYLEGRYSEVYPEIPENKAGMTRLCKQFSFPYGVSSHVAPAVPGSMHEGGELGYSLLHGYGAVLDNKDLIAAVVVGDGEAETGSIATAWHVNRFLNPVTDGAVLPILHLNGYKISNPTLLSRISKTDIISLFYGYGYEPIFVEAKTVEEYHAKMAKAMDKSIEKIKRLQERARSGKKIGHIDWPMIILKTPKGWTCPKVVDDLPVEGTFRSHQVPVSMTCENHLKILEKWLKSYKPSELFDDNYKLKPSIKKILPKGNKRISANPVTNGGDGVQELKLPNVDNFGVSVDAHGKTKAQDMAELGKYIRDIFEFNKNYHNFRIFSPDEAISNRLKNVFDVENRTFNIKILENDEFLSKNGRVFDSYLSENVCEGLLEGYVLTGRYGMFNSYEAFVRVIDSMVGQHAKWLKIIGELPWRKPIPSLNLILTSNVWQQDHNGYTHQEPGFIDYILTKKPENTRVYLPADANTLICAYSKAQKSTNLINTIVASKHETYQWLCMEDAKKHLENGVSVWDWASNDGGSPDVVLVTAGDTVTIEGLAAVSILKTHIPELKVRFVNVVDLMKLRDKNEYSGGLSNKEFDSIFTTDKPIVFNFHGYTNAIYALLHSRTNKNVTAFGYKEEGSITTAFDMRVQNEIDRYHLVLAVLDKVGLVEKYKHVYKDMQEKLQKHKAFVAEHGVDMPEVANWKWE